MSDDSDPKSSLLPAPAVEEFICKLCNLVFGNDKCFKEHREHGDHYHAAKGKLPGSGKFHCLLCWKGFIKLEALEIHIKRKDHNERCKKKGMLRFFVTPEQFSNMTEDEKEVERKKEMERDKCDRIRRKPSQRERSPRRINLRNYYEVDSIGELDTAGVKMRRVSPERRSGSSRTERSRSRISRNQDVDLRQDLDLRKSERRRENSTVKITAITDVGSEPKDADHPSTDLDAQSKGGEEEVKSAVDGGVESLTLENVTTLEHESEVADNAQTESSNLEEAQGDPETKVDPFSEDTAANLDNQTEIDQENEEAMEMEKVDDVDAHPQQDAPIADENSTAAGEVETKVNGEATNGEEAMETNPVDADATSVTNSVDTDANSENSPVETDSVKPVETKLADISDKPAVQETQTIIEEII